TTPTTPATPATPEPNPGEANPAAPVANDNSAAGLGHLLVFTGFLGPLIVWALKKDTSPFVKEETTKALNFGLTITLGYVAFAIVMILLTLVLPVLSILASLAYLAIFVLALVFGIKGYQTASQGNPHVYPFTLTLIK
ncbi:MAG: DUF4870 domain-containing protein, partial [Planctomycetota bacterium]